MQLQWSPKREGAELLFLPGAENLCKSSFSRGIALSASKDVWN